VTACEQPGEGNLRRCGVVRTGHLPDQVDKRRSEYSLCNAVTEWTA